MIKRLTSTAHPLVKHLVKLREDKNYRHAQRSALIQGRKMVAEVTALTQPNLLVVTDERLIPSGCRPKEIVLATEAILKKISGTVTPEGLIAEVPLVEQASLDLCHRVLVLDTVADPGNLGTLLRTALALGWDGAYLINCCDPYNDKALRAAMGATFRLPWRTGEPHDLALLAKERGWKCLAANLQGKDPTEISEGKPLALVLGNEAHGVSPECQRFCESVTIKMSGVMESMNVSIAGAILMYLLR